MSTPEHPHGPTEPAPPTVPHGAVDPWPHEHGEHPSGVSVPDGGRPRAREPRARLIGEPEPVASTNWARPVAWVLVALVVVAAAVAAALTLN
jgi:hypothetical protein